MQAETEPIPLTTLAVIAIAAAGVLWLGIAPTSILTLASHSTSSHTIIGTMKDIRKKLQDDLNAIERELRVDLPKEILRAREHGDLSENAEYKAAKERQSYLEGKKANLQARLASLSLINLDKIPHDRVAYGSRVVLFDYQHRQGSAVHPGITGGVRHRAGLDFDLFSDREESFGQDRKATKCQIVTPSGQRTTKSAPHHHPRSQE